MHRDEGMAPMVLPGEYTILMADIEAIQSPWHMSETNKIRSSCNLLFAYQY